MRNSGTYFASERAYQGGFPSYPSGMPLSARRFVEALDRGPTPLVALLLAIHPTEAMSRLLPVVGPAPRKSPW